VPAPIAKVKLEEEDNMLRAPGVVLIDPKFPHNVATTIRACVADFERQ
jgi:hypothetical protein